MKRALIGNRPVQQRIMMAINPSIRREGITFDGVTFYLSSLHPDLFLPRVRDK
ncbi:hypothetical protein ACFLXG_00635 [Chloroflexota bacterium]